MSEHEFMDELEAATRMKPSEGSHFMLITIASLVGAFFIWSGSSEIEEITRGSGQVVPTQEIQVVQSLEGGILEDLLVREGQKVEKDQILLKVSDVAFASEERGVEARASGVVRCAAPPEPEFWHKGGVGGFLGRTRCGS